VVHVEQEAGAGRLCVQRCGDLAALGIGQRPGLAWPGAAVAGGELARWQQLHHGCSGEAERGGQQRDEEAGRHAGIVPAGSCAMQGN